MRAAVQFGQRQLGAAAKAFRRDAFDMAVADEDQLGHWAQLSSFTLGLARRGAFAKIAR
jgi:hypothetical protein